MPLILFFVLSVYAQNSAPQWIEESWRTARYSSSEWYTGFVSDNIKGQPSSEAFQAIEKKAQNKLSESIQVQIKGSSTVQNTSKQSGKSESTSVNYKQSITTQTDIVLAKVETKSYFDKNKGVIYAFAAVKKRDLAGFYKSMIASLLSFAEKELFITEQYFEMGKKSDALAKINVIEDSLKSVSVWASVLQAVESDNSHVEQEKAIWQKTNNTKILLQSGTKIYLNVSEEKDSGLNELLAMQMHEKGCNCAMIDSKELAEYVVMITAKLNRCEVNKFDEVYCYAVAAATVNNQKRNKSVSVKIPETKGGWTKGNTEKASEEAFKEIANTLAEKIIRIINQ